MSLPDIVDGISGIGNIVGLEEISCVSSVAEKKNLSFKSCSGIKATKILQYLDGRSWSVKRNGDGNKNQDSKRPESQLWDD